MPAGGGGTPYSQAVLALRWHASALVDGDEAGWLAAVDPAQPALQARYRGMYASLRALGVTQFQYVPEISKTDTGDPQAVTFPARAFYCFGTDTCRGDGDGVEPEFRVSLTMRPVDGRYVITRAVDMPDTKDADPAPWEDGNLVVDQGRRVVVAAEQSEAGYLARVLPIAESAAETDDRFAKLLNVTQTRYRIFLAGEKQWHTWYGGEDDKWVIGASWHLSRWGTDVVIRVRDISSDQQMRVTLQHEMGHVVTLAGTLDLRDRDRWLSEGVAEYIGWWPRPASQSYRVGSARAAVRRHRLTSMIPADPGPSASLTAGDAYYGLSHFAVSCMATTFGEARMLRFVRAVLIFGEPYDQAAHEAYGKPFSSVDKTCASWMNEQL